ncbi:LLM class flavin-dependent oxidoreductase [Subtercola sp. PAMC28395]|uniref:LLM class flavin-dependent oxidoreductase n=1 Tax=Subtercola sp. PAMC28395 TaxID=2846775 RepID=UPI001C0E30B9|nr:LLM class flavin-dependent oxidoreductase [Subtercola sp. PAMC28395]QWT24410.1 LLM class flavin-dependent oxidoreductase [Subtercola sp. PAMC28395]
MKIGLFGMPLHPPTRNRGEVYVEDAERVILADKLGFEEVFIGEHVSCTTEPIPAPMMFLASLISRTERIKLGTGVLALPNHHPALVAAEAAMFDHLSNGRFLMGIGPGGLASDMELFGVLDGQIRNEKMMESIDIILDLWKSEPPYQVKTKHYEFGIEATLIPELGVGSIGKPLQQPHPPILSTAMSPFSGSVKSAVERGWAPMTANFCPQFVVQSHWQKYVEGCDSIGVEATGDEWRVSRNMVIASTDAEAKDRVFDPDGGNYYYFSYLWEVLKAANYTAVMKQDPSTPDEDLTVEDLIESMVIYGSPDTVTEKLQAFRESTGPFGTLLLSMMDGSGVNEARERETMTLLANEVAPRFQGQPALA